MLEDLRKRQKIIIYFVAVIFILGMGAMGITEILRPKPYLGKVEGKKISLEMYQSKLQEVYARYSESNPNQPIDDNTRRSLEGSAWQELVDGILWDKQIKKHKIKVTDSDILTEMQNNPPQELMQNESLQTNGRFDKGKYLAALKNAPDFFLMMEDYVSSYLPRKRLQEKIQAKAGITIDSLKAEYKKENDKVSGEILFFDYNTITDVTVSDDKISEYYEAHKEEEYKKGPATRVMYLSFNVAPSDKDFAEAKRTAVMIRERIMKGEDFGELAREYSEDPGSGQNGGSLGEFGKGQMVPEFEKAAFALEEGAISQPVKSDFGWHIIRLDKWVDRNPEVSKVEASHILFKVEASETTKGELEEKALEAQKMLKKKNIEDVAKAFEMEPKDSDWVAHDAQYIPGIGQNSQLLAWMIKAKKNQVSELVRDQQQNIIVAKVVDNAKVYYEDFEKVKLRIKYELEREMKIAKAKVKADEFVAKYTPAEYFAKAEAEGWKVTEVQNYKRGNNTPGIGVSEMFADQALALEAGQTTKLIHDPKGSYIFKATIRERPDLVAFEKNNDEQKRIRESLESKAWNRWYQEMRENAEIIDRRAEFGM
ncbi:MAG: peptidylprolyl isomerase [Candidatus Cloacimonetes bacterium]|jgi:parvulin-like peptidyl-prolyl isomerase|nr:peptidylprolyl isomerase [Candidatus Cloacimonadota bacterium]MDY0171791.1 peptidylprolyl isomerase [Candidatus Cloacimonadaceae bacterium]